MYTSLFVDFTTTSLEKRLVLGVTLHRVPPSWSLSEIVRNISLFTSLRELKIVSFISMFRETTDNGYDDECGNKVHLLCDSLDSKTTLLRIRVIPFVGDKCGIIVIRPMKSIIRLENVECVYTIPKYGNIDVAVEMAEAMKLLDENNISLKYATLIAMNILNDDYSWNNMRVETIWPMLASNTLIIELMTKLTEVVRNHKTPKFKSFLCENKYDITDIFDTNTLKWAWETNLTGEYTRNNKQFSSNPFTSAVTSVENKGNNYTLDDANNQNYGTSDNYINYDNRDYSDNYMIDDQCYGSETYNRLTNYTRDVNYKQGHEIGGDRLKLHTGCIRFEKNRNRWVVDLTLHRFRNQKCFHVSHYGFIGGLQAARKWRYDYMSKMNTMISPSMERKVFKDIWDKIHMMDQELWPQLVAAVTTPIEGYEDAHNCININEYIVAMDQTNPT